ncbi:hypothetical protein B5P44_01280 [Mycobacterium sp. CBMA 213]|nr:hypothetical protein [Mycolicibacterium sp. CBMA 213]
MSHYTSGAEFQERTATRMAVDDPIPELTTKEQVPTSPARSDTRVLSEQLLDGATTDQDIRGARKLVASTTVDHDTLVNTLQVPEDAGAHADGLRRILVRIPDGWGRWISHESGWYPIIIDCDQRLSALDANYVVHQVKEKFGTLRYYCEPSGKASSALADSFRTIIAGAERSSATTCERCGQPGQLHNRKYWLKTLCDSCAQCLGYEKSPSGADNDD